jgi:hypothetical protein
MSTPEKVWMNGINLAGLWSPRPLRGTYEANLREWYWRGNLSVSRLGLDVRQSGITTFASESKREVEIFTLGAWAVMRELQRWSGTAT